MLKLARLLGVMFSLSLRRQIAFRADLLFQIILTAVGTVASVAALGMVFTQTDTLDGWRRGQALALLGTFQIVSGIRAAFVDPNFATFGDQVRNGAFDSVLVQPAPAIFLASLSASAPLALSQIGFGAAVTAYGIHTASITVTPTGVVAWLALIIAATAVMWATRTLFAALIFASLGLQLDVVYDAIWQFARYPVDIYRQPLRLALTYVLPVAFLATIPTTVLLHSGDLHLVPIAVAVSGACCLAAHLAWKVGLRRYTSATS
jgi:ABC-2 type transport system permease protein